MAELFETNTQLSEVKSISSGVCGTFKRSLRTCLMSENSLERFIAEEKLKIRPRREIKKLLMTIFSCADHSSNFGRENKYQKLKQANCFNHL